MNKPHRGNRPLEKLLSVDSAGAQQSTVSRLLAMGRVLPARGSHSSKSPTPVIGDFIPCETPVIPSQSEQLGTVFTNFKTKSSIRRFALPFDDIAVRKTKSSELKMVLSHLTLFYNSKRISDSNLIVTFKPRQLVRQRKSSAVKMDIWK